MVMKKFILLAVFMLFPSFVFGDVYVCVSKDTGQPAGVVDIKPDRVSEWAKLFTMKIADESFRGKDGYEIKVVDSKLRLATKQEIDAYKAANKIEMDAGRKQDIMNTLGITEDDLVKLKAINGV
jgi:hypothetical protein